MRLPRPGHPSPKRKLPLADEKNSQLGDFSLAPGKTVLLQTDHAIASQSQLHIEYLLFGALPMTHQAKGRRVRFVLPGENPEPAAPVRTASSVRCPGRPSRQEKPEVTVAGPVHRFHQATVPVARVGYWDLMFTEQFMVWSSRFWRLLNEGGAPTLGPLEIAFTKAGIRPALGPFDALMTIFLLEKNRTRIAPADLTAPLIPDEKRLLFVLATPSKRMRCAVLANLISCQGAIMAKPVIEELRATLSGSNYKIPHRQWAFPEIAALLDLHPDLDAV